MAGITGPLRIKIFVLNLLIPVGVGAFRQAYVALFNPDIDLSFGGRLLFSLQPTVFAAIVVFALILYGIIMAVLNPLFTYLNRGERYDAARKAAIRLPWYLMMLHVGLWIVGTTAVYALAYRWEAPGGVPYMWSLLLAVVSGFITGLYTAIVINNLLLPAKRRLFMKDIRTGEVDVFIRSKDSVLVFGGFLTLTVFFLYGLRFYLLAETPPPVLSAPVAVMAIAAAIIYFAFWRMHALSKREYRYQVDMLKSRIHELSKSGGDLTQTTDLVNFDEIGELAEQTNQFLAALDSMVANVKSAVGQLETSGHALSASMSQTSSAVSNITKAIEEMKQELLTQVASVSQSSASTEQISKTIESLNSLIADQSSCVTESSAAVEQTIANVRSATRNIEELANNFKDLVQAVEGGQTKISTVNEEIEAVARQSESLGQANELIAEIAARTNLLAMNAAIEAAHAGEAGRGFAVVAAEIRNLAESSSEQSRVINEELKQTREVIERVVAASAESQEAFQRVVGLIEDVDRLQQEIRQSMVEQSEGSEEVLKALSQITDITSQVRSGADEMQEGSTVLRNEMYKLQDLSESVKGRMEEISHDAGEINGVVDQVGNLSEENRTQIDRLSIDAARFVVREDRQEN